MHGRGLAAHQAVGQLEHVVAQADDDELRVLGALLDVVRHDAHVLEVCTVASRHAHQLPRAAQGTLAMVPCQPQGMMPCGSHALAQCMPAVAADCAFCENSIGISKSGEHGYREGLFDEACEGGCAPSAASISSMTYSGVGL